MAYRLRQHRQPELHLSGTTAPQFPCRGKCTPRRAAPPAQHVANLSFELSQFALKMFGSTMQRFREAKHRSGIRT
ncbi:hypothetical protein I551_0022 [Mycobacterium ulcerans str. Harvey]|uniref:Uncharacterized protein n=1 Tax=Mycobacterium ulcerans str. Harvey TaxID=1299332 RepID=A0ABN0R8I3_MYCUL|nr:hypothetical protein I551_0022 [Mycobacterium ulcerans str. Harvey]OIN30442.1 hypothetical protein A3649_23460 [Mycobacterium ulcerans]